MTRISEFPNVALARGMGPCRSSSHPRARLAGYLHERLGDLVDGGGFDVELDAVRVGARVKDLGGDDEEDQ